MYVEYSYGGNRLKVKEMIRKRLLIKEKLRKAKLRQVQYEEELYEIDKKIEEWRK